MSWPTITYGKTWQTDCEAITGFTKTDNGNTSTFTSVYGDYFMLDVTVKAGAEETKVVNDVDIDSSTASTAFSQIMWRYKCSNALIKAKVIAEFDDATTQEVMADTTSQSWTVGLATLTPAKTLDHIRLYADHAVGTVYYDFVIVFQGTFTFPGANLVELVGPPPRKANIPIPGKDGLAPQNLGSEPAQVRISADMDTSTTWNLGKVFDQISHDLSSDLWQWLTLPAHDRQFKATLAEAPRYPFENCKLRLELLFEEYKLADARALENYAERFGH